MFSTIQRSKEVYDWKISCAFIRIFCYCSLRAFESAGGSQVSKCGCAIVVRRHSCMKCRQVKRFLTVRVFVEAVCESSALEAQHTVFYQLEMLVAAGLGLTLDSKSADKELKVVTPKI